eukprot:363958-Chlamydomonas_euryale.AAC.1
MDWHMTMPVDALLTLPASARGRPSNVARRKKPLSTKLGIGHGMDGEGRVVTTVRTARVACSKLPVWIWCGGCRASCAGVACSKLRVWIQCGGGRASRAGVACSTPVVVRPLRNPKRCQAGVAASLVWIWCGCVPYVDLVWLRPLCGSGGLRPLCGSGVAATLAAGAPDAATPATLYMYNPMAAGAYRRPERRDAARPVDCQKPTT